ncbi:MAG: type II toxin-antitoxin system VapC family toxin [Euryarchaeota archaeon]|nr:type II toxin-antitoxin system VapC family toxin [Euryarchaeota archaeon]
MRYLDASIPLCTLIGEPKEKLESCEEIMKSIELGKERVRTTTFTVAEIAHILMKREREHPMKINESIKRFLECAGLSISDARKDLCLPAIELALKYEVDFIDSHHRLTMQLYKIKEVYSLDHHFDKFPGIKRFESLI